VACIYAHALIHLRSYMSATIYHRWMGFTEEHDTVESVQKVLLCAPGALEAYCRTLQSGERTIVREMVDQVQVVQLSDDDAGGSQDEDEDPDFSADFATRVVDPPSVVCGFKALGGAWTSGGALFTLPCHLSLAYHIRGLESEVVFRMTGRNAVGQGGSDNWGSDRHFTAP